jgi:hypothetical protein
LYDVAAPTVDQVTVMRFGAVAVAVTEAGAAGGVHEEAVAATHDETCDSQTETMAVTRYE